MTMPTCRIVDLADVLIEASGRTDVSMIETGIRPGEKIHEILMSDFESLTTVVYDEQYLVILPTLDMPELKEHYRHFPHVSFSSFSSENHLMEQAEIKDILIRGGFLQ